MPTPTPSPTATIVATPVKGVLTSGEIWGPGAYRLTSNVLVAENQTLTIRPDTTIDLGGFFLQIDGELTAVGEPSRPIRFTAPYGPSSDSNFISFTEKSKSWGGYADAPTGSVIKHAVFGFTPQARGLVQVVGSGPLFSNITAVNPSPIRDHSALSLFGPAQVVDSRICGYGTGIAANRSGVVVRGSTICDNRTGLYIGGGGVVTAEGNVIEANARAVHVESSSPLIRQNVLRNNADAVWLHNLGTGARSPTFSRNSVFGTCHYLVYMYGSALAVTFADNWWGTTDQEQIANAIFDFEEDFRLGKVTFEPILTSDSEVPTRASGTAPPCPSPIR